MFRCLLVYVTCHSISGHRQPTRICPRITMRKVKLFSKRRSSGVSRFVGMMLVGHVYFQTYWTWFQLVAYLMAYHTPRSYKQSIGVHLPNDSTVCNIQSVLVAWHVVLINQFTLTYQDCLALTCQLPITIGKWEPVLQILYTWRTGNGVLEIVFLSCWWNAHLTLFYACSWALSFYF